MNARQARLELSYNNKNITEDLTPYLESWSFTDNLSGQADDLQIDLMDREHLWMGSWLPEKGAVVKGKILTENWEQEGKVASLPLGHFEIDDLGVKGPPSVVSIKAISVPESSSLRGEEKNRAWEKTKLSVIANDIASKNKLKLFYDVAEDVEYERIEQSGESDIRFLMRLCDDAGLGLKVTGNQINIFDEEKYEKQSPIMTIKLGESNIKNYTFQSSTNGTYRACRVEYHSAKGKKNFSFTFTPANAPKTGRTLVIKQEVSSVKEAERLAKKRLRKENKEADKAAFVLMGDIRLVAGVTVKLDGFGGFNGKYIVTQATHGQSNGYETAIQLRKVLEGY